MCKRAFGRLWKSAGRSGRGGSGSLNMEYEINPDEVRAKLDQSSPFTLLDVREPWEVETASIASAKPMPMGDVPARAYQELDPEEHIVVICHHGVRSLNVTAWLRQQ